MAYQVAICAVGIYFMEDALQILKKYTCCLHEACMRHFKTKHKSAIVRKIGSYATWVEAPKCHVVLSEDFRYTLTTAADVSTKCNCISSDSSCEEQKDTGHLENRIEELEKELLRLQAQVSNILLKTDRTDKQNGSDIDDTTVPVQPSNPPPLPPPPPPLPPAPLVQTRTLLVTVKPKGIKFVEKDSRSTILEELSKRPPKLRHVERSPGGRPIRSAPPPSDPADILAAVLRKRFEAIHGEKQECYMPSPDNTSKATMITGH